MFAHSIIAALPRAVLDAAESLGIDAAGVCAAAGVEPAVLEDPDARVPLAVDLAIWQVLSERPVGLELGARLGVAGMGVVGYALQHGSTVGEGLRWLQRTDRAIFDDHGRIFEFQSVSRDITDRKRLEDQILAAQAHLVQAARMATIGEVASGVAHQIYNPLTTIIADAQILLRSLPAEQPGRDSAEAIEQAGWRLQQVVQRLLEFSRPVGEELEPVSINQTIQSAVSLVNASLESIGCRLDVDLAPDLPAVRGNARQIESLWVNLLLLARDAVTQETFNGYPPTIRITSRLDPPDMIAVEVSDNGIPIPAELLGTIFEPNFIGNSGGRGAGMELSICREIVRQHNGEIRAISAPEHDTIFRVSLPAEV